jgi:hypothetical protein
MLQVSPDLCAEEVWMEAVLNILVLNKTREGLMPAIKQPC